MICDQCETVAHCTKHGCVPKQPALVSKDEALDLALEALENSVDLVREDAYNAEKLYGNYPSRQGKVAGLKVLADDHEKAITAIKQARALDKKAENARELGLDYEPVAYIRVSKTGHVMACAQTGDFYALAHGTKLYTTPPAQPAPAPEGRDWSLLEATQESLREHMSEIKRLKAAQPAVPDAIGPNEDELPAYVAGWNDCRQAMLEMMK
jgi:hypothetical protein